MSLVSVVAIAVAAAAPPVEVIFFGEALCPFCRDYMGSTVNTTLSISGIYSIMTFEYVPWGNAYYATSECGGTSGGPYVHSQRACWNTMCSSSSPLPDCIGPLQYAICQHGGDECYGNQIEACVKTVYPDVTRYMPFMTCFEYTNSPSPSALASCAAATGLSAAAIAQCDASRALGAQARRTLALAASHTGVPWVSINGVGQPAPTNLLKAVCAAYTGTRPSFCTAALRGGGAAGDSRTC